MGSTGRLYIWVALLLAGIVVVVWACRTQGTSGDLREQLKEAEQQLTSQQAKVAQLAEDLSAEEAGASGLEESLSTEKESASLLSSLLAQALDKSNKLSQQIARLQARLGEPTPTPTPTPTGAPAPTPAGTPGPTPTGIPSPTPTGTPSPSTTPLPPPTGDAIALARQAVVLVKSSVGEGSGFIFDQKGLVLTTAHAVGEDPWVTVVTGDAVPLLGDVVGRHIPMDLAVIRLRTQDQMPALALADSSPASFRDEVMFLGYPRGSALGQGATVTTGGFYTQRLVGGVSYLQVDASLTPGYAGGPLINGGGEAIGIYTDRLFQPGAGHTQGGAAFAIAMNSAKGVIPALSAGTDTPAPSPTTTPTRETLYRNVAWGYALRLPPGWQTEESRLDAVLLWTSEPAVGGEVFSRLATEYTVESWTDSLLDAIRSRATAFEELSRNPLVLATGVPGLSVLYTATFPSYEAPLKVRMVTAMTINRSFVLQLFAEESAWEEHVTQIETMASTFIPTP